MRIPALLVLIAPFAPARPGLHRGRIRGRTAASAVLLAAAVGCASPLPPPQNPTPRGTVERAAARLPLRPCTLTGTHEPVLCGGLQRPENPSEPHGRSIDISVIVIPALSARPARDPWVELAGGPGIAATEYASDYIDAGASRLYRRERDVLLVAQRGMGGSNGLYCEELARHRISWLFARWPLEAVRRCGRRLAATADLSQYSTENAADDLEAVREWLGYDKLNLFSYSYGTRASLTYMHRHPSRVRSAILWGVVPPDFRRPLYYARDAQQGMDRLLADCAADIDCARAFPDVRADLSRLLERLDREPVAVTVTDPDTGAALSASVTRTAFSLAMWDALTYPDRARKIPLVIHRAARGDFLPFIDLDVAKATPRRRYYNAAHLSIVCPEETQHIRAEEIEPLHRGTFMPADHTREYLNACDAWGLSIAPASTLHQVRSEVPTLILSGYMDPVTPPALGDRVAQHLVNVKHVIARHLSHESNGLQGAECLNDLFLRFLSNPDPASLDDTCVHQMRPPAFVTYGDRSP